MTLALQEPPRLEVKSSGDPSTIRRTARNQDGTDLPSDAIEVVELDQTQWLADRMSQWQRLIQMNREPNVFLEPQFLLPAWDAYASSDVRILVATAPRRDRNRLPPIMCGLLPIMSSPGLEGRFGRGVSNWMSPQSFLGHPLLRRDCEQATFSALMKYLSQRGHAFVNLTTVPGEGPFQSTLTQYLQTTHSPFFVRDLHHRALYRRPDSIETFLAGWSRSKRQSINRLMRRLHEQGDLSVNVVQNRNEAEQWVDQFLAMESQGWKGDAGTALASTEESGTFLRRLLLESFDVQKCMLMSLRLDDAPVAMKCNLLSGNGGVGFKIAFDESLGKFSPGCLLEKIHLECLFDHPHIQWMDSCAQPNHPMIDSLWPDRRTIQSITLATPRRGSGLTVAALPLARWMQRTLQRR